MKKAIATITITAIAIAGGATAASAQANATPNLALSLTSTDNSLTSYEGKLPTWDSSTRSLAATAGDASSSSGHEIISPRFGASHTGATGG